MRPYPAALSSFAMNIRRAPDRHWCGVMWVTDMRVKSGFHRKDESCWLEVLHPCAQTQECRDRNMDPSQRSEVPPMPKATRRSFLQSSSAAAAAALSGAGSVLSAQGALHAKDRSSPAAGTRQM